MGRVICVSNRVSLPDPETGKIKAGGLAVGVKAALESVGGGIWFGWSGAVLDDSEVAADTVTTQKTGDISFMTMPLKRSEYDGYYKGMSNSALWPLMHELDEQIDFNPDDVQAYEAVNKRFAKELKKIIQPGDVVWVHDYHFFPLGQALRDEGITPDKNKILFFNHIPVPSADFVNNKVSEPLQKTFKTLMKGLEAYDRVGFQALRDVKNYMGVCNMATPQPAGLPARFNAAAIVPGAKTEFGCFPISIETRELEKVAKKGRRDPSLKALKQEWEGQKIMVGAERLDYTKGLLTRLEGVSSFFKDNPGADTQVKYMQVTPLSRADLTQYKSTIKKVQRWIGNVNGNATFPHQPVRYMQSGIPREKLVGLFRLASVGLVTSLMDGQNLVAKEYLAAQDSKDPGVLVLSKTTGAAEELGSVGALLIDPRDPQDIADKIKQALSMPLKQRQENHKRALRLLRQNDINNWAKRFLNLSN